MEKINWKTTINEIREDCAKGQRKGIHFMLASILVWTTIFMVQLSDLSVITKNIYCFWCTGLMFPTAILMSKLLGIDFKGKSNPLNQLGILFTCNQLIYLCIALWMCNAVPDKMLMVFTMIYGAHLLPYSWLYRSKTYFMMAIGVPILALVVGLNFSNMILALVMIGVQCLMVVSLMIELNVDKRREIRM